jgi:hypothetical protein
MQTILHISRKKAEISMIRTTSQAQEMKIKEIIAVNYKPGCLMTL